MRVGLVGYGAWGRCHARALLGLDGVKLAGVFANGEVSAAEAASLGVPVVRDLPALLALGIDAVDIVSPNFMHEAQAVAALNAGKHVLMEKPMALTNAGCAAIIAAARAAGKQVSVTHELRVSTQLGRIKRDIDAGVIGLPQMAQFALFRRPFRPGAAGWRHDIARVGSWVLEEPVHFLDLLCWYFEGHGNPVTVAARGHDMSAAQPANLAITVRYASGALFTVNQMLSGFGHHWRLELSGSAGSLRTWWSGGDARITTPVAGMEIQRHGADAPELFDFPTSGEIFELTEHLRTSIAGFRAGFSAMPPGDGARSVQLCLAAEEACRTGAEVRLAE